MPHDVTMPQLGMAQDAGKLVAWLKQPGDAVSKGDALFEQCPEHDDEKLPNSASILDSTFLPKARRPVQTPGQFGQQAGPQMLGQTIRNPKPHPFGSVP